MDIEFQKQTVLIVDDMPINIQVLARSLKKHYNVKVANTGAKALDIAFSPDSVDLILLDIMMPGMSGYEVCRSLKSDPRTVDIPIIFITAKGDVEDETYGLNLGAVDYIIKPFHLPIVEARVKNQLRLKRKSDFLEKLVSIDGLTDIHNRRGFEQFFEKEWKRAQRVNSPISLLMIDIDHFKQFNDTYGHGTGDDCLKMVAHTLKNSLKRATDFVARYGGEEFVVILAETKHEDAVKIGEMLRAGIEAIDPALIHTDITDRTTISVGVATVEPASGVGRNTLREKADQQLYKAKENGRNQVK